jgi:hypothetical protein
MTDDTSYVLESDVGLDLRPCLQELTARLTATHIDQPISRSAGRMIAWITRTPSATYNWATHLDSLWSAVAGRVNVIRAPGGAQAHFRSLSYEAYVNASCAPTLRACWCSINSATFRRGRWCVPADSGRSRAWPTSRTAGLVLEPGDISDLPLARVRWQPLVWPDVDFRP